MKVRVSVLYTTSIIALCLGMCVFLASCGRERSHVQNTSDSIDTIENYQPFHTNIYIENSGSMAGYCNVSDTAALETLIKDYYDRLKSCSMVDSVSLNLINTSILKSKDDEKTFLKSLKGKCTAPYTKINDMLRLMTENTNDSCVNIMISDYSFTSPDENPMMASSAIAVLFTKQLKLRKDMSVAIFKYMRNFKGNYYPGRIPCNKPLPIYAWVFGKDRNVQEFVNMPLSTHNCGEYFLQLSQSPDFVLSAQKLRMITKDKKGIWVSKWDSERRKDYYEFVVEMDLSNSLLAEGKILDATCYQITSNTSAKYEIVKIEPGKDKRYKYTIRTNRPSPGGVTIQYPIQTPVWVAKSNFDGNGLPSDSTTFRVKYLIDGVSKAFKDVSGNKSNYFEININLK